jgi:hypothetical protein
MMPVSGSRPERKHQELWPSDAHPDRAGAEFDQTGGLKKRK